MKENLKKNLTKQAIIKLVLTHLTKELSQAIGAANQAHAAAIDDQSVAETQYDTLAIEASYLAEGQSRRVQEYQNAIHAYQNINCLTFHEDSMISETALVQLSDDETSNDWFFIGPAAGGFRCQHEGKSITVITPQSPMGIALIGRSLDDDIEVKLGGKTLSAYIAKLY